MNDLHFAVVVGIDLYPGIRNLNSARGDAQAFSDWLKDAAGGALPGANVQLILEQGPFDTAESAKPTRDALLSPKWEGMKERYELRGSYHIGQSQSWDYQDILTVLNLAGEQDAGRDWEQAINAFIECCLAVNYLQPHDKKQKWVVLRTSTADSAFLLSNLFGMKTSISGFDELFGGGGLILGDQIIPEALTPMGGRAILTVGRYGTGKSLLSLQFAIEVARKGGLAYVMTVEQSPEECLYAVGSVCALPSSEVVEIATDSGKASHVLERHVPGRGGLVLINPLKDSFRDFLETFKRDLQEMQRYPLRLVVVDAVTAIPREQEEQSKVRGETLDLLQEAKRSGTNIWLLAEEGGDKLQHYENISDTVIRLSGEAVLPYSQRYFEIAKSRFQREQRGKHPFSILPGSGMNIFPSTAAVSARIQPRSVRPPDTPISFGLPALDEILGTDALCSGDVIVLQGPTGTFKTPLGMLFMLALDKPGGGFAKDRETQSLLVSAQEDPSTIRQLLHDKVRNHRTHGKRTGDIRLCSISGGYVKPGYILHRIEEELLAARLTRGTVDRVMIDNVSHWGLSCPFVQEDRTFGDTLVDLLRRHQVTSLFTCNDFSEPDGSALRQSVVDSADCLIQFQRVDFRGTYHVMLRILKTRGMRHRRESFELVIGTDTIDVRTNSSLLRVTNEGRVEPVRVRLFLHNQVETQQEENQKLVDAIQSIISPYVSVETDLQDSSNLVRAWTLGNASALDELQVLQIDEFQLPALGASKDHNLPVHVFPASQWNHEWNDLVPRLRRRIQSHKRDFIGVPMYQNIGFFAYRLSLADTDNGGFEGCLSSWEGLVDFVVQWEQENPDPKRLCFDFATTSRENYNCLFLEILLSLVSASSPSHSSKPKLADWLFSHQASVIHACMLFRRLTRRAHFKKKDGKLGLRVEPEALIWRLWFNELNQLVCSLNGTEHQKIGVTALPKDVSIAGEWFLTVPAYSAAQDVGLQIIKLLTTHDAELSRLSAGIGLPTRSSFYKSHSKAHFRLANDIRIDGAVVDRIVNQAFARSHFENYGRLSGILSAHLQTIIELPDEQDVGLEENIRCVLTDFQEQANFVQS
jgi:KaiC/GvpD/RAD55 family RecA-like ATPase